MKLLFACVARTRVLGRENANRGGGFLVAANHISHFDPFLISLAVRRKIDWMTMAEFFRARVLGSLLRAIDAFSAERDRADLKTIRTAIERLKSGRVVGLFPEGGIRDGTRSLLEGAPLRPGASTLAQIAGVPVLPCVILGSDRLYFGARRSGSRLGIRFHIFQSCKKRTRASGSNPNWRPHSKISTRNYAKNFGLRLMICRIRHRSECSAVGQAHRLPYAQAATEAVALQFPAPGCSVLLQARSIHSSAGRLICFILDTG